MNRRADLAANAEPRGSSDWVGLLGKAVDDVSRIMQMEIRLTRAQLSASIETTIADAALALVASVAILAAGACLATAAILLLHQWLQLWIAFAIAGNAILVVGLILRSLTRRDVEGPPARTAQKSAEIESPSPVHR